VANGHIERQWRSTPDTWCRASTLPMIRLDKSSSGERLAAQISTIRERQHDYEAAASVRGKLGGDVASV
jgi:hypothetical protein